MKHYTWPLLFALLVFFACAESAPSEASATETLEAPTPLVLSENSLGAINLASLRNPGLKEALQSASSLDVREESGRRDGPDYTLYEVSDAGSTLMRVVMDWEDASQVERIWVVSRDVVDQYGVRIGMAVEEVAAKRAGLQFHADLQYQIYASVEGSRISYLLEGALTMLNEDELVAPDYSVEPWQVEGMTVSQLIWQ